MTDEALLAESERCLEIAREYEHSPGKNDDMVRDFTNRSLAYSQLVIARNSVPVEVNGAYPRPLKPEEIETLQSIEGEQKWEPKS